MGLAGFPQRELGSALFLLSIGGAALSAEPSQHIENQIEGVQEVSAISPVRKGSWVAVPIPVANPTLGAGLQFALLYLHPQEGDSETPNATSGVGAMYTDTESWGVGVFHDDYWFSDTYRFRLAAGTGAANLDYYGVGDGSYFEDNPLAYQLEFDAAMVQLQRRFPGLEDWYVGAGYVWLSSALNFKTSSLLPGLPDIGTDFQMAGLSLIGSYDSRDDNYYPTAGAYLELKATDFADAWGSDLDFRKSRSGLSYYHSVGSNWVLATRAELQASSGDTPFFALSNLNMRGFSKERYLADYSLSVHAEARYRFNARWGTVGFVEKGWVSDEVDRLDDGRSIVAYGMGLRWRPTVKQTLNLGIDAAWSEDDSALYVRIGEWF